MWKRIVLVASLIVGLGLAESALERVHITETDVAGEVATPQERIDTLRRALLHLPQPAKCKYIYLLANILILHSHKSLSRVVLYNI